MKSKSSIKRYRTSEFESGKEQFLERILKNIGQDQMYLLGLMLCSNDSFRSKYIEEIFSHAITPMNYTGEGDVCDIWLSFKDINLDLLGISPPNIEYYRSYFFCSTILHGFMIEVKCSRKNSFKIPTSEGYAIPFDESYPNQNITDSQRWSDFYIFTKLKEPQNTLDTSHLPFTTSKI